MKKIKILTITLLIIAVTMIAFWGVYTKEQNRMKNQIKGYETAMDLKGSRTIRLKVNTENKTVIKDAEGKEVEEENLTDEQIVEKGYVKEDIPNNSEEVKNADHYKKSKEVIEKRLAKMEVTNYIIKLDEVTGDIVIELTENDKTDQVIANLYQAGKFEIVDSETKEVLMTNQDIKQAKVMYGSGNGTTQGTSVYLEIEFNQDGRKKLEEISNQYTKIEEPATENTEEIAEETTEENTAETVTEKKITMNIDDSEIMSTSFDTPVRTGKLQLSFGGASTDLETLQGNINQASSIATVLDSENMPVKYDLDTNQYILSDLTGNEIQIAFYVILAIVILAMLVLMIRYKIKGILGVISYIGFISFFLIVVRYTNVVIAMEGIFGMLLILVLNYILVSQLLAKEKKVTVVYKDFFIKMIPIIIMVIAFCFIKWISISSFGMTMLWGIALMLSYNFIITNSLLKIEAGKEK